MNDAETNLRECQRQLDMDGCEVGVSRQALEETLDAIATLRRERGEALEALGKCLNFIENTEGELRIELASGNAAREVFAKLGATK